jgi:hypothetical protein
MTIKITDKDCELVFELARTSCPDGGISQCYSCTRELLAKIVEEHVSHELCVSLPNFPISKTSETSTNTTGVTFVSSVDIAQIETPAVSACADGDFCKRIKGRIVHDKFCNSMNHADENDS